MPELRWPDCLSGPYQAITSQWLWHLSWEVYNQGRVKWNIGSPRVWVWGFRESIVWLIKTWKDPTLRLIFCGRYSIKWTVAKKRNSGKLIVVFYEGTGLIISERAVIFYTGCNPRVVSSPTVSWSCQEFLSYPALWLVTGTRSWPLIGRWLPSIPVIQTCHFLAWQSTLTSHNAALASYCQLFRKKCFIKNPLPHSPREFFFLKLNSASQMSWKNFSLCAGWGQHY